MKQRWETAMRTALAPARELEPTQAEIRRVLALDRARRPRRARALGAVGLALLAATVAAVPATRAGVGDVYEAVSGWFVDDRATPGRPLDTADDVPAYLLAMPGDKRIVAESGTARLYAVRNGDTLEFQLGESYGEADTIEGWRDRLAEHRIVFLGPGSFARELTDAAFRRPLMGLTARSVTRVELRYRSGPPTTVDGVDGGFVVRADIRRRAEELVAFDAGGRVVDRADLRNLELRFCTDVRGCPPGRYELHAPPQG